MTHATRLTIAAATLTSLLLSATLNHAQPSPATRPSPATHGWGAFGGAVTNIQRVDYVLGALRVAKDVVEQFRAAAEPIRKKVDAATANQRNRLRNLQDQMNAMRKDGPGDADPLEFAGKYLDLDDQVYAATQAIQQAAERFIPDAEAVIFALLDDDQVKDFKRQLDASEKTLLSSARGLAVQQFRVYKPLRLAGTLQDQMLAAMTPLFEQFLKAHPEFVGSAPEAALQRKLMAAQATKVHDIIAAVQADQQKVKTELKKVKHDALLAAEKLLSDQQRGALKQERSSYSVASDDQILHAITGPLARADLTDDQQPKVTAMLDAVRQTLAQQDPSEPDDAPLLQFQQDLRALLTDEQKTKYDKAGGIVDWERDAGGLSLKTRMAN